MTDILLLAQQRTMAWVNSEYEFPATLEEDLDPRKLIVRGDRTYFYYFRGCLERVHSELGEEAILERRRIYYAKHYPHMRELAEKRLGRKIIPRKLKYIMEITEKWCECCQKIKLIKDFENQWCAYCLECWGKQKPPLNLLKEVSG